MEENFEEFKANQKELIDIFKKANQDTYFGSSIDKLISVVTGKMLLPLTGFYAGLSEAYGLEMSTPLAAAGLSVLFKTAYTMIQLKGATNNLRTYIDQNVETTTDKQKIREMLDEKVRKMNTHEINNYLLTDKGGTLNLYTQTFDLSDFILKQYIVAVNGKDEEKIKKVIDKIPKMEIEDRLNLSKKQREGLEMMIHPRAKYLTGTMVVISSGFFCALGYAAGRIVGSLTQ